MWNRLHRCAFVLGVFVASTFTEGCRCERQMPHGAQNMPKNNVKDVSGDVQKAAQSLVLKHTHTWAGGSIDAITSKGDDVVVAGSFKKTLQLGKYTLTASGGSDLFVARLSPDTGEVLWVKRFGGPEDETLGGLTHINDSHVAIVGSFKGTLSWSETSSFASQGKQDIFAAQISIEDGTVGWTTSLGSPRSDVASDVAAHQGRVILTGYFMGAMHAGETLLEPQSADVFLIALDAQSGQATWAKRFGGSSSDKGRALAVAQNGDIVVTGAFRKTADFGGPPLTCAGSRDAFVARYDAQGNHLWSMGLGGNGADQGNAVVLGHSGDITVAGFFQGSVSMGPHALEGGAQRNPFVARLDDNGQVKWAHGHRSDLPAEATALAWTQSDLWVVGSFQGEIDLGGGQMSSNSLSQDLYLVRTDAATGEHRAALWMGDPGKDISRDLAVTAKHVFLSGSFDHAGHYDAWLGIVAHEIE